MALPARGALTTVVVAPLGASRRNPLELALGATGTELDVPCGEYVVTLMGNGGRLRSAVVSVEFLGTVVLEDLLGPMKSARLRIDGAGALPEWVDLYAAVPQSALERRPVGRSGEVDVKGLAPGYYRYRVLGESGVLTLSPGSETVLEFGRPQETVQLVIDGARRLSVWVSHGELQSRRTEAEPDGQGRFNVAIPGGVPVLFGATLPEGACYGILDSPTGVVHVDDIEWMRIPIPVVDGLPLKGVLSVELVELEDRKLVELVGTSPRLVRGPASAVAGVPIGGTSALLRMSISAHHGSFEAELRVPTTDSSVEMTWKGDQK